MGKSPQTVMAHLFFALATMPVIFASTQFLWAALLYPPLLVSLPWTFLANMLGAFNLVYLMSFAILTLATFCSRVILVGKLKWIPLFTAPIAALLALLGTNHTFDSECQFQISQGPIYGFGCHSIGLVPWALMYAFYVFPQPANFLIQKLFERKSLAKSK